MRSAGNNSWFTRASPTVLEPEASLSMTSTYDKTSGSCDPLYVFACWVAWRSEGSLEARQQLLAALGDRDPEIRLLAKDLLKRDFRTATKISRSLPSERGA